MIPYDFRCKNVAILVTSGSKLVNPGVIFSSLRYSVDTYLPLDVIQRVERLTIIRTEISEL